MRKEQGMTQRQVADELSISDKTVSKWETGKGLPEVSLMMPLCEILKINVNELLFGEKLSNDNYREKAEENMMNLVREKEESKKRIIMSFVVAIMCASVLFVCVLLVGYVEDLNMITKGLLIGFGVIIFIVGVSVAIVLDRESGTFECSKCGHQFTPDMKAYVFGPHTLTKRYLKCPECGKSGYCKHKLIKKS